MTFEWIVVQKQDTPLEISKEEERKNPFLESPDDEDVVSFSGKIGTNPNYLLAKPYSLSRFFFGAQHSRICSLCSLNLNLFPVR